jgi:hypothetical protein
MLQQLPQRHETALALQQPKQLQQKAVATLLSALVTCQMH